MCEGRKEMAEETRSLAPQIFEYSFGKGNPIYRETFPMFQRCDLL